jgi:hypothetical protein
MLPMLLVLRLLLLLLLPLPLLMQACIAVTVKSRLYHPRHLQ